MSWTVFTYLCWLKLTMLQRKLSEQNSIRSIPICRHKYRWILLVNKEKQNPILCTHICHHNYHWIIGKQVPKNQGMVYCDESFNFHEHYLSPPWSICTAGHSNVELTMRKIVEQLRHKIQTSFRTLRITNI